MATWTTLVDRANDYTITHDNWNELLGTTGNLQFIHDGAMARAKAVAAAMSGSGAFTKIPLNSETADPLGWYDAVTNFRFQPTIAGTFGLIADAYVVAGPSFVQLAFFLNGAFLSAQYLQATAALDWAFSHATSVELNGSSDYIEVYLAHDAGSDRNVNAAACFFRIGTA